VTAGKFITVEGGEGAGKSTQAKRLQDWLAQRGIRSLLTREPGGTVEAEEIRRLLIDGPNERWDPLTETLLHFAARRIHIDRAILPALAAGKWVICDRFADSTMAYQGYGLGIEPDVIAQIYEIVIGDIEPDLTIIFDLPIEAAFTRLTERGETLDRYERRDREFHQRVRDGFHQVAADAPSRCCLLDASGDQDHVAQIVESIMTDRLGAAISAATSEAGTSEVAAEAPNGA